MRSGEKILLSAADELIPPDLYLFLLAIDAPDYAIEFARDPTADAVIAHVACIDPDNLPQGNLILFGDPEDLGPVEHAPRVLSTIDWPARPAAIRRSLARSARWLQRERQLRALANSDPLTGLLNRRGFELIADRRIARAAFDGEHSAVLLIDADHFKQVNDRYGHAAGDELLRCMSAVIRDTVRAGDVVGRIGGEEMAVVMPGALLSTALATAERLRATIADMRICFAGREIGATVSIGVASTGTSPSYAPAFREADEALYRAKGLGRNRVVCGGRPSLWSESLPHSALRDAGSRFVQPAIAAMIGTASFQA
jgi:diguanylate cyclase (GGDEF)-like protein